MDDKTAEEYGPDPEGNVVDDHVYHHRLQATLSRKGLSRLCLLIFVFFYSHFYFFSKDSCVFSMAGKVAWFFGRGLPLNILNHV